MGLTEYLDKVSDYWSQSRKACWDCDLLIEHGHCAMLHDHSVPDGDCLGVADLGIYQPSDAPNYAAREKTFSKR